MNEFDNMIKVGELADKKVADEIVQQLLKRNIHLTQVFNETTQNYVLFAKDHVSAQLAFDYYRVRVGLAAPPRPNPKEWEAIQKIPLGPITLTFLGIGLFVFASKFFIDDDLYQLFYISKNNDGSLREFNSGEYWRIFTPVFLHFNFVHILFNGLWMKDLGSLVESFKGKKYYLLLLFASGVLSNLGQYYVKGPYFGGLSGIVYALLGFVWMNKKFDESSTYSLPSRDVKIMIGWFFLCFTGVFGPIANTAHGIGLAIGMLFGIFSGSFSSKELRPKKVLLYCLISVIFGVGTLSFEHFILPMITGT